MKCYTLTKWLHWRNAILLHKHGGVVYLGEEHSEGKPAIIPLSFWNTPGFTSESTVKLINVGLARVIPERSHSDGRSFIELHSAGSKPGNENCDRVLVRVNAFVEDDETFNFTLRGNPEYVARGHGTIIRNNKKETLHDFIVIMSEGDVLAGIAFVSGQKKEIVLEHIKGVELQRLDRTEWDKKEKLKSMEWL